MSAETQGFDTHWLDLREPADRAARDAGLLEAFANALPPQASIADLGSGTGSTLRAIEAAAPSARWTLIDNDPALLSEAARRHAQTDRPAETLQADLAADIEAILAQPFDAVTCSALIDLVSEDWLKRLVPALKGRPIYAALTYDGNESWQPPHPNDDAIEAAFQRDMRRDKGFGPALGPIGAPRLATMLEDAGYSVQLAPSPWRLTREDHGTLIDALASGTATAARAAQCAPDAAQAWETSRMGTSHCVIGHIDLLALPN